MEHSNFHQIWLPETFLQPKDVFSNNCEVHGLNILLKNRFHWDKKVTGRMVGMGEIYGLMAMGLC